MARRKRRRRVEGGRKTGGALVGLRSGFKRAAQSVAGSKPKARSKGSLGTVVTLLMIVGAVVVLYLRYR